MSSRKQHCKRSRETFGQEFEHVHAWLDELSKYNDEFMDINHRIHRHNKEGLAYILNKWGETAMAAAEQHILDDMGCILSKEEMIQRYGDKKMLRRWEDVFGGSA